MKLYVVMVNDRHSDPEPFVFSTPEAATDFARREVNDYAQRPADVVEQQIDGWLYCATYSPEGDSVWVLEKVLDEPVAADG